MASVVIIGAGIIGTSTAHYLTALKPKAIHLIESSPELFASASGKSGGFLAADWFSPAVAPLGALSFKLHRQFADEYDGKKNWGYTSTTGASYADAPRTFGSKRGEDWLRDGGSRAEVAGEHEFHAGNGPAWLTRKRGDDYDVIGADETCAQVDPLRLSTFLLNKCKESGVQLHQPANALSITRDADGRLATVRVREADGSESDIECSHLLVSAGAWSPRVFKTLFPQSKVRIPISQLAGHSLVIRSPRWTDAHEKAGCHALFTTTEAGFSPEIFSRIGGDIYIAGLNSSSIPLPDLATDAKIDQASIEELKEVAERMLGLPADETDLKVTREGLCFRPVTSRGTPILSRVPDETLGLRGENGGHGGVYLAAGHGPWGISMSLGTGKVMSEMMMGEKLSAKVSGLSL